MAIPDEQIFQQVGKTRAKNPWVNFETLINYYTQKCADQIQLRWSSILAGTRRFIESHCETARCVVLTTFK